MLFQKQACTAYVPWNILYMQYKNVQSKIYIYILQHSTYYRERKTECTLNDYYKIFIILSWSGGCFIQSSFLKTFLSVVFKNDTCMVI